GGESYALDLADIAGLHLDRRIAPVSGSVPEWLGMAGIRGTLVSVYSLAMLMGHDRPSAAQTRWLALCGTNRSIGLAFEAFEHHFSLDPGRITPAASGERNAGHVSAIADTGEEKRLIIHVGAILTTVSRLCAAVTAP